MQISLRRGFMISGRVGRRRVRHSRWNTGVSGRFTSKHFPQEISSNWIYSVVQSRESCSNVHLESAGLRLALFSPSETQAAPLSHSSLKR